MTLRVGSLFSGTGALDVAVHDVFGAETAWFCEYEPPTEKTPRPRNAGAKVLAHRFAGVPNFRDVAAIDWVRVPPVDVLVAGYPCQSQSQSGLRLGQADERWLWPPYLKAIRAIRPRWACGENVEGHVTMDLRTVIADLQLEGYAVAWVTIAASDIGACHQRRRVFWLAWPEEHGAPAWASKSAFAHIHAGQWGVDGLFGVEPVGQWPYQGAAYQGAAYQGAAPTFPLLPTPRTSDTNGPGDYGDGGQDLRTVVDLLKTPTQHLLPTPTVRDDKGNTSPAGQVRADGRVRTEGDYGLPMVVSRMLPTVTVTDANGGRNATAARSDPNSQHHSGTTLGDAIWDMAQWGKYGPAIAQHEAVLGRPAPPATGPYGRHGEQRLCGRFTEWMMMLPEGWVTGVPGITNKDAIRLCGNGVVAHQAAFAYRYLRAQVRVAVAA